MRHIWILCKLFIKYGKIYWINWTNINHWNLPNQLKLTKRSRILQFKGRFWRTLQTWEICEVRGSLKPRMPFHKYLMIGDQHLEMQNTVVLLERMNIYNTTIKWAVKIPLFVGKTNTWSTYISLFLCLKLSLCLSTFCSQGEEPEHKHFKFKENLTTHRKPEKWLPYFHAYDT